MAAPRDVNIKKPPENNALTSERSNSTADMLSSFVKSLPVRSLTVLSMIASEASAALMPTSSQPDSLSSTGPSISSTGIDDATNSDALTTNLTNAGLIALGAACIVGVVKLRSWYFNQPAQLAAQQQQVREQANEEIAMEIPSAPPPAPSSAM